MRYKHAQDFAPVRRIKYWRCESGRALAHALTGTRVQQFARLVFTGVALIFVGLLAAACGPSSNSSSQPPATGPSSTTGQSSPTSTMTPVRPPTTAPSPVPQSGAVLYQTNWSSGMSGWAGTSEWKAVGGMLVSDGSVIDYTIAGSTVLAPYAPPTSDYAVEAVIQFQKCSSSDCGFGVAARLQNDSSGEMNGYIGGVGTLDDSFGSPPVANIHTSNASFSINYGADLLGQVNYTVDTSWHTYRLEVRGNQVRLSIDGRMVVEGTDNRFLAPGRVGILSHVGQISIRSFKVTAL